MAALIHLGWFELFNGDARAKPLLKDSTLSKCASQFGGMYTCDVNC